MAVQVDRLLVSSGRRVGQGRGGGEGAVFTLSLNYVDIPER